MAVKPKEILKKGEATRLAIEDAAFELFMDQGYHATSKDLIRNAARALVDELGSRPELLKLIFIELVEFNGKHVTNLVNEIAPKIFPMFEKMIHVRKNLRKIPAPILVRSFLGMFFSFYITELFIKDSIVGRLMPKNSFDLFVDIYLHGVIKETA